MAKYLDTGSGNSNHCLGAWLEREVVAGVRAFRAQFGFFSFGALEPFAAALRTAGEAGATLRLVIGSNHGSLSQVDLSRTWQMLDGLPDARLTVIAYSNAMFHPKVVHLIRHDGSAAAIVGSGNLTDRGMAWNVEASISLDQREGDDQLVLADIAREADRWHQSNEDGVYQISSDHDVRRLTAVELIDVPQPELPPLPEPARHRQALTAGKRPRLWRPPVGALPPPPLSVRRRAHPRVSARQPQPPPAPANATPLQWSKQLRNSDAQQVGAGTNPTGKLRLTESGHPIDHRSFFRHTFFQPAVWTAEVRAGGRTYEVADIDFDVSIDGRSLGVQTLRVDHALHREAGQGNVVTVLGWGPLLSRELRNRSYVRAWVVIERRVDGTFALRIQQTPPPQRV